MRKFFNKVIRRLQPKSREQQQSPGGANQPQGPVPSTDATPATQPQPTAAPASGTNAVIQNPVTGPPGSAGNSLQVPTVTAPEATRVDSPLGSPITVVANGHNDAFQHPIKAAAGNTGARTLATSPTLQVNLVNRTTSSTVYCYVTGQAINNGFALFLLQADGVTPYYPTSPNSTGTPLSANVAIALGAPGNTRTITIPQLAGARIWFSIDTPLVFLLNPGPALVEPSVVNQTDPNIDTFFGFAEFTFNQAQLYANVSYVDFVGVPIELSLQDGSGQTNTVTGIRASGLNDIANALMQQTNVDGQPWRGLIVDRGGRIIRILSPNSYITIFPSAFQGYFEPYVNQVWSRFANTNLVVSSTGASGNTSSGQLNLNGELFNRPSTNDIFSANSGPFATGPDPLRNSIVPVLAAAFNRTTLLEITTIPAPLGTFYQNSITNWYARIVHQNTVDGRGYAFPYDDVNPSDAGDQSGFVNSGNPALLTVTVGGGEL